MNPCRPVLAVLVSAAFLASCGTEAESDSTAHATPATEPSASAPTVAPQKIIIRTRMVEFTGRVLRGSVLGDAAFCLDGAVRHERGTPEIGFPAINVFTCETGSLRVGFGPGPDQMDQSVQTSGWRVLDGTGSFAGSTGQGTMRVEFGAGEPLTGRETFIGAVAVP